MNTDPNELKQHERARLMIALSVGLGQGSSRTTLSHSGISNSDDVWLSSHLESCLPCREFAENSRKTIRSLRGIPIAATGSLVSSTQMRVRQRTQELERQQERFWVVCTCVAAVTLSSAVSAALLWHAFEWMGQRARLSPPVWEGGFVVVYLAPAVLAGIVLLTNGTFFADHSPPFQNDPDAN
jgi:hypothetical protein